ncbi:MAG: RDD family protein [bacterium]
MQTNSIPDATDLSLTSPPIVDRVISGFWRRLLAFIIDSILLGILGYITGLFLFDFYAQLGGAGLILGFFIALLYFGLFNSSLGKGQTLGKRIMRIEVVDSSGNSIPLSRSLLRFTILGIPYFLNGAPIPSHITVSPIGYGIGFLIFGFGGAIVYLYIFNRRTRQSLHDLIMGTLVVRTIPKGKLPHNSVWKTHLIVVGVWFLLVIGFSAFASYFSQSGIFPEIRAVQQKIESSGEFRFVTVMVGKSWRIINDKREETSFIHATVVLKENQNDYDTAAKKVASFILNVYPDAAKKDFLVVTVSYGYNIGIASSWQSKNFPYTAQEYQQILSKPE